MARRPPIDIDVDVRDAVGPVLTFMVANMANNILEFATEGAQELQQYAQANAPWSDITGAARSGLTADAYYENGEVVLELFHTVDYGQWLEVIQDGRFAILLPTIEALGPDLLARAGAHVAPGGGDF